MGAWQTDEAFSAVLLRGIGCYILFLPFFLSIPCPFTCVFRYSQLPTGMGIVTHGRRKYGPADGDGCHGWWCNWLASPALTWEI